MAQGRWSASTNTLWVPRGRLVPTLGQRKEQHYLGSPGGLRKGRPAYAGGECGYAFKLIERSLLVRLQQESPFRLLELMMNRSYINLSSTDLVATNYMTSNIHGYNTDWTFFYYCKKSPNKSLNRIASTWRKRGGIGVVD